MRIPLLFLALQLTVLALLPCRDLVTADGCASACESEILADGEEAPDDHEDDCSILCSCSCCGALVDTPPALTELRAAEPPPPVAGQTRPASIPGWKTIDPDTGHGPPPRA